jgi:hemerythrin-like domain-containing protein
MARSLETNIAVNFYNIHSIITRGLRVSLESVRGVIQDGFQDQGSREGLFNYIRALASVLNSHHLTEDEIAFPYFRDKLPDAPFDSLMAWHQKMVGILNEIKAAVEKCDKNDQLATNLRNLENALARLSKMWPPHIQVETNEFITKADALIPVEEQLRLVGLLAQHGQKLALPPYLTVPFMLFNLPVVDRQVFSQGMPAEVLEKLVPVVWKEKWESMAPFLLV